MNREELMKKTSENLSQLDDFSLNEVADFTAFLLRKKEEDEIQEGIHTLISNSSAYQFLHDDPDLYTLNDLKERYK